jgi:hypothetical protein
MGNLYRLALLYLSWGVFEQVAGLAVESVTEGFKRFKAYGFGFTRFQNRQVGQGNPYPVGEFGQRHFAPGHHHIYVYNYRHGASDG